MSAREFSVQLDRFMDEDVPQRFVDVHTAITLELARGIIFDTPVDKGRAINNWNTAINEFDFSTTEATDKSGREALERARTALAKLEPYGLTTIANGIPYIVALEDGHSQKAANGMVAINVNRVKTDFGL